MTNRFLAEQKVTAPHRSRRRRPTTPPAPRHLLAKKTKIPATGRRKTRRRREVPAEEARSARKSTARGSTRLAAAVCEHQDAVPVGDAVPKRKFFPSARFPFSLSKNPAAAGRRDSGEAPLDRDCAALIERLEELGRWSGSSSIISAPMARLIEAVRSLALMDSLNIKSRREAQFELLLASTSLTMVASREKLEEELAMEAKKLASEAAALLAKSGGLEHPTERSNDFLFCITISGALALLPYLTTQIPDAIRPFICVGFGLVFYAASVGAILSFKATNRSQLKVADIFNTLSFGGFSLLVVAFICSALASGSIILVSVCALVLVACHFYAWSRT